MLTAISSPASSALAVYVDVAKQRRQQSQLGEAESGSGGIQQHLHLGSAMKDGQKGRGGGDRQVQGVQAESFCRSGDCGYELQQS